jgi:glutamate-1-semialdehyde aminotransferase
MQVFRRAIVSSTYGGETLALAAAKATLQTYQRDAVVEHLWRQGECLWPAVNRLFAARGLPISIGGFRPCPAWSFTASDAVSQAAITERFFRASYRRGLSLYNVSYLSFSHHDADIQETTARFEQVADDLVKDMEGQNP